MIDYRRITSADVPAVTNLAERALRFGMGDSQLRVSSEKVRSMVQSFADCPGHFQLAAFKDGQPVGAIAAHLAEMPFFERCEAHVVMCYCIEPYAGRRLIRALLDWAAADMRIRRVVWAMNHGADQFARVLAKRFGLARSEMMIWNK